MKKVNVTIQTKLRLVDEINALELKIEKAMYWHEFKANVKEIDKRLEYFTEMEKEIFFGKRYNKVECE